MKNKNKQINLVDLKFECDRVRKDANKWTKEYRQYLYEMGMKVVNGECKMPYIGSLP